MNVGEIIAARARACVGVRFRPQGRDPSLGLDCIGLAAIATGLVVVRSDYAIRGDHLDRVEFGLLAYGFEQVGGEELETGDILVFAAGPQQVHVAVLTDTGIVHADAGLRRVVERPLPLPWPVLSIWRLSAERTLQLPTLRAARARELS